MRGASRWSCLSCACLLLIGCTNRVIESGRFGCTDDSDCLWGWRCLPSESSKVCVNVHGVVDSGSSQDKAAPVDASGDKPDTPGICGDGRKQSNEQCDLRELNSDLPDAPCRPDCTLPRCGDGVQDSGEQCDGGEDCSSCELANTSSLLAFPPMIHFGAYSVGCGVAWVNRTLTLVNASGDAIELKKIVPSGPSCGGVSIDWQKRELASGSEVGLLVSLKVAASGLRHCVLRIEASDGVVQVPVTALIADDKEKQIDRFVQQATRKVDILLAIDPSGSMSEERARLMATTKTFAAGAAGRKLDFHLGSFAITEPGYGEERVLGQLHGDPRFITSQSKDLESEFKTRVDVSGPGAYERGFDAIAAALGPWLSRTSDPDGCMTCEAPDICASGACRGHNWGFRRTDASLEILVLTDEDDGSKTEIGGLLKSLVNPLINQSVRVHALLPLSGCACGECEEAPRWKKLINDTGGLLFDLCSDDFTPAIQAITDRVFGLQRQFFLLRKAKAAGIKALINAKATVGFDYDPDANAITFAIPPPDGARIEIHYDVQCD